MRPVLAGKRVVRFSSTAPGLELADLSGRTIAAVEARGKNLLVTFDDGRVLHTHLRMHGSWHLYGPGDRWKVPAARARVVIDVGDAVAVCFDAPVVRLLTAGAARRDLRLGALGPDPLGPTWDASEARARLRARGEEHLGVAVMVQSALAGVGNVYKSEVLFMRGLDPFAPVTAFRDDELDALVAEAARLLARNVATAGGRRRTRGGGTPLWVYGRKGKPCFKCGAPVAMKRQGPMARSTYYCPRCQPARLHRDAGELR